eukprot:scaffold427593_cov34-Prasinocladus_malaysianus.AAC.1
MNEHSKDEYHTRLICTSTASLCKIHDGDPGLCNTKYWENWPRNHCGGAQPINQRHHAFMPLSPSSVGGRQL